MRSVVWTVARKETREILRDGRFRWTAAGLLAVLCVAPIAGWRQWTADTVLRTRAAAIQREEWLDRGRMHPHMAAHDGTFVFKPLQPLAALDPGVDPEIGGFVFLEAHRQNHFGGRAAHSVAADSALGTPTVARLLQLAVPLLVLLLVFPAFSREREQQTLGLALSSGIRARDLAAGKFLGSAMPLVGIVVAAAGVSVLATVASGGIQVLMSATPRLAAWLTLYLTYYGVLMVLGLAVSAVARSSREALAWVVALWFANCVMAPTVAIDLAARLRPVPTVAEFEAGLEQDLAGMPPFEARVADAASRLVREHGMASPGELPVDPRGVALAEGERESTEIYRRHMAALFDTYVAQERLYELWGAVAPAVAVERLSMALAGTDIAHHRRFAEAADAYREEFVQRFNQAIAVNDEIARQPGDTTLYSRYLAGRELWEQVPRFTYEVPPLSWALGRTFLSLLIGILWGVVALAGLIVSVRRLRAC